VYWKATEPGLFHRFTCHAIEWDAESASLQRINFFVMHRKHEHRQLGVLSFDVLEKLDPIAAFQ